MAPAMARLLFACCCAVAWRLAVCQGNSYDYGEYDYLGQADGQDDYFFQSDEQYEYLGQADGQNDYLGRAGPDRAGLDRAGPVGDSRLVAHWDHDSCGPPHDGYDNEWCGLGNAFCRDKIPVSTEVCPSGSARLPTVRGGGDSFASIDGCDYYYSVQYECVEKVAAKEGGRQDEAAANKKGEQAAVKDTGGLEKPEDLGVLMAVLCILAGCCSWTWRRATAKKKPEKEAAKDEAEAKKKPEKEAAKDEAAANKKGEQAAVKKKGGLAKRSTDVQWESGGMLPPILGVMKAPDMPVFEAAVATDLPDMKTYGYMAKEHGRELAKDDPHGLDADECGALNLYSSESGFYNSLNAILRNRDRTALKPYFPVLKLMERARRKLPKSRVTIWRGVQGIDLQEEFPDGKEVWWWAITSGTTDSRTMENDMFLGPGPGCRTMFMIEAINAMDMTRYSYYPEEAESLLFPGTKLRVKHAMKHSDGLVIVQMEELEVEVSVFE